MGDGGDSKKSSNRILAPENSETSMSISITGWLHEARAALAYQGLRVSGLSDRDLRDIGLKPRSLTTTVYREIGKSGLVDFGWRLGR